MSGPALGLLGVRRRLSAAGFLPMHAFSDLHFAGWQGRRWLRVRDGALLLVYSPRWGDGPPVVVRYYRQQCAFHQRIGLHCVGPGQEWTRDGQQYLF